MSVMSPPKETPEVKQSILITCISSNIFSILYLKALDIIVLIIIHSAAADRKKPIESLFRNKVRTGHFTEELLQATFTSHASVSLSFVHS